MASLPNPIHDRFFKPFAIRQRKDSVVLQSAFPWPWRQRDSLLGDSVLRIECGNVVCTQGFSQDQ